MNPRRPALLTLIRPSTAACAEYADSQFTGIKTQLPEIRWEGCRPGCDYPAEERPCSFFVRVNATKLLVGPGV